jgi:hypothetical protein
VKWNSLIGRLCGQSPRDRSSSVRSVPLSRMDAITHCAVRRHGALVSGDNRCFVRRDHFGSHWLSHSIRAYSVSTRSRSIDSILLPVRSGECLGISTSENSSELDRADIAGA